MVQFSDKLQKMKGWVQLGNGLGYPAQDGKEPFRTSVSDRACLALTPAGRDVDPLWVISSPAVGATVQEPCHLQLLPKQPTCV
jgi:hypothetical protein